MFSLAHLSDPHLPLPPGGAPWAGLTGKQMLSRLAWHRKRRHITREPVLAALGADLAQHAPDHIAVTGDLVNLAAPVEIAAARRWLETLGSSRSVSVVPGNHDRLRQTGLGAWAGWMGDGHPACAFPFLRRRGEIAIIGLCSGLPTPMFMASGRLGSAQLDSFATLLADAGRENLFRVVLIHHPPVIGNGGRRKALRDRAALSATLRRLGAELVLHGHHHQARLTSLSGRFGPIPIIGVPSASAGVARPELGGWNLHRIARSEAGWTLTTILRRYDTMSQHFEQAGAWRMELGINRSA